MGVVNCCPLVNFSCGYSLQLRHKAFTQAFTGVFIPIRQPVTGYLFISNLRWRYKTIIQWKIIPDKNDWLICSEINSSV